MEIAGRKVSIFFWKQVRGFCFANHKVHEGSHKEHEAHSDRFLVNLVKSFVNFVVKKLVSTLNTELL